MIRYHFVDYTDDSIRHFLFYDSKIQMLYCVDCNFRSSMTETTVEKMYSGRLSPLTVEDIGEAIHRINTSGSSLKKSNLLINKALITEVAHHLLSSVNYIENTST